MTPKRKHDPGYKLPEVIDPDNCCICIPIPNDFNHKMAFLGQLDELGYWWNWERDALKQGREAAAVWRNIVDCIREEMDMSGCGCEGDDGSFSRQFRYDSDGQLETSTDNGETWQDGSNYDVRNFVTLLPPRQEGAGTGECLAAENAVDFFKNMLDTIFAQIAAGGGASAVAPAVVAILVTIGFPTGLGALLALVYALISAVIGLVNATLEGTFDGAFYDDLKCYFFCVVDADGTLTTADLDKVYQDVSDRFAGGNPLALAVVGDILTTVGALGFTNAARGDTVPSSDCEACDECDPVWCYLFDYVETEAQQGWSVWSRATAGGGVSDTTWTGTGWQSEPTGGAFPFNDDIMSSIKRSFTDSFVTDITVNWTGGNSGLNYGCRVQVVKPDNSTQEYNSNGVGMLTKIQAVNQTIKEIRISIEQSGTQSGYPPAITLNDVQVTGEGVNPIGEDNCP